MWHVWVTGEVHTQLWWGDLRERSQMGGPTHRWEDSIKMDLEEVEWETRLMTGTDGGRLLVWK